MRRCLPALVLTLLACNLFTPSDLSLPTPVASPVHPPTATFVTAASPTATPDSYQLRPSDILFYPTPQLYSGDQVSLAVSVPPQVKGWDTTRANLYLGARTATPLASVPFTSFGLGERTQATFRWEWDTTGLTGPQNVIIEVLDPAEPATPAAVLAVITVTVNLLPAEQLPLPEAEARWSQTQSACCIFHYLTHTAAARDIRAIRAAADGAFEQAETALAIEPKEKSQINLLSRLLGHGGFAAEEISLTYIDRNPLGDNLHIIYTHEAVHLLLRGQTLPILLNEGLATYVAGGHYTPENFDQRAAALLALGQYLPLAGLADNFYPSQHEIGYLEGAAFIKYLVDTYGWDQFQKLLAAFRPADTDRQMLAAALPAVYGQDLADLETGWLTYLRALPVDPEEVEDLRLSLQLYDTLRRYQQLKDPAAYFLTAWLPDPGEARVRSIVADFIRHPNAPENIALETLLNAAAQALAAGDLEQTEALLTATQNALDTDRLTANPLAADYWHITTALAAQDYEAQTITLEGDLAHVTAIRDWPQLEQIILMHTSVGWQRVMDQ